MLSSGVIFSSLLSRLFCLFVVHNYSKTKEWIFLKFFIWIGRYQSNKGFNLGKDHTLDTKCTEVSFSLNFQCFCFCVQNYSLYFPWPRHSVMRVKIKKYLGEIIIC